jgi:hypothetical protein
VLLGVWFVLVAEGVLFVLKDGALRLLGALLLPVPVVY